MRRSSSIILVFSALFIAVPLSADDGTESGNAASVPVSENAVSVTESGNAASGVLTELSLEKCLDMARQNNVYILNSNLDIQAARAQKSEAFAEYFPKVSVMALGFYAIDPMLKIGVTDIFGHSNFTHNLQNFLNSAAPALGINPYYSTMQSGFTASVSVIQPVFAGGRIVNGNRLAQIGVEAAVLQKDIKARATDDEIEKNYWQIVSLEEKLSALGSVEDLLDTLERDVASACDAGLATITDLYQVKLKKNELRSGRLQLVQGIRLAKMNLFNGIGVEYNPYSTFGSDTIPYIDEILLTDCLGEMQSPDNYYVPEEEMAESMEESKLLDLSVEAKRLEKKMALGEALPQIGVGALYGYNDFITRGSFNGAVFASVQIPISDWGKTAHKMKRLDYQMQKAENERDYLSSQLILQVHKLWMDLTAAWEQLLVAQESVDVASAAVSQSSAYYLAGMIPVSELLQIQTDLTSAKNGLCDARIAYKTALQSYLNYIE